MTSKGKSGGKGMKKRICSIFLLLTLLLALLPLQANAVTAGMAVSVGHAG